MWQDKPAHVAQQQVENLQESSWILNNYFLPSGSDKLEPNCHMPSVKYPTNRNCNGVKWGWQFIGLRIPMFAILLWFYGLSILQSVHFTLCC